MFPGGKGGRCVGLTTLPLHVPIVLKSGIFNLLEPSGPVQASNGIALPLLLPPGGNPIPVKYIISCFGHTCVRLQGSALQRIYCKKLFERVHNCEILSFKIYFTISNTDKILW